MSTAKKRRIFDMGSAYGCRITRGYLHWLFDSFWGDVDGPIFDCLMEWCQDEILILQTIRTLGKKYQERVGRLFPYGFGVRNLHPDYYYRCYADFNDLNGKLVGLPVYLNGLVKIKIIGKLCLHGCYTLGIRYGLGGVESRELVIVEIIRDLTTPPGLYIFSPFYNDIMNQKYQAFHQTLKTRFPMMYHVDGSEIKLCPQNDSFHYIGW
jgi:hypothetical protein